MCGFFNKVVVGVGICMMDMLLLVVVFFQSMTLRTKVAASTEIRAFRLTGYVRICHMFEREAYVQSRR